MNGNESTRHGKLHHAWRGSVHCETKTDCLELPSVERRRSDFIVISIKHSGKELASTSPELLPVESSPPAFTAPLPLPNRLGQPESSRGLAMRLLINGSLQFTKNEPIGLKSNSRSIWLRRACDVSRGDCYAPLSHRRWPLSRLAAISEEGIGLCLRSSNIWFSTSRGQHSHYA